MSDYPTKVWEAADGTTHGNEVDAVVASKEHLMLEFMLERLNPYVAREGIDQSIGVSAAITWFVKNRGSILEAFEDAEKYAETKVVPS